MADDGSSVRRGLVWPVPKPFFRFQEMTYILKNFMSFSPFNAHPVVLTVHSTLGSGQGL